MSLAKNSNPPFIPSLSRDKLGMSGVNTAHGEPVEPQAHHERGIDTPMREIQ
jgi:hypothetical protein